MHFCLVSAATRTTLFIGLCRTFPLSPKGEAHTSRSHSWKHKLGFGRPYWILRDNHLEHGTCTSLLPSGARIRELRPQLWNTCEDFCKNIWAFTSRKAKTKNILLHSIGEHRLMHFHYNPCSEFKTGRKMGLVSFEFSSVSKHSRHWWDLIISEQF